MLHHQLACGLRWYWHAWPCPVHGSHIRPRSKRFCLCWPVGFAWDDHRRCASSAIRPPSARGRMPDATQSFILSTLDIIVYCQFEASLQIGIKYNTTLGNISAPCECLRAWMLGRSRKPPGRATRTRTTARSRRAARPRFPRASRRGQRLPTRRCAAS